MIARREKKTAEYKLAIQALATEHNEQAVTLTAKIGADSKLKKDLQFVAKIVGWSSSELIHRLLYDARRFSQGFGSFRLHGIDKDLDEDYYFWRVLPQHAADLADEIEKANKSKLSPAHTAIHRDANGEMLNKSEHAKVVLMYKKLPEILRSWALELKTKVDLNRSGMAEAKKEWPVLKKLAITEGLEESVFEKVGQYHEAPMYRLLSAAAGVIGIEIVAERAFRIRLNRQKKALHGHS